MDAARPQESQNGAESKQSQNGAESKQSQNGAESKQSQNGAEFKQSQNGAESKQSQNGAESKQSQNGAEFKQSQNGTESKQSQNGAESKQSQNGTESKQSQNGAESKQSQNGAESKLSPGGAEFEGGVKNEDGTRPKEVTNGKPSGGAVCLQLVNSLDFPFQAGKIPAFSSDGRILLEDSIHPQLHFYELRAGKFVHVWRKPGPPGMNKYGLNKAICRTGKILLKQCNLYDTIQYSLEMENQKTFRRKGRLVGCNNDGHVLYCRWSQRERNWRLDVWNEHHRVMTLCPPVIEEGRLAECDDWDMSLSFCLVGDKIAIVECYSQSLDIFTKDGGHVRRCHLGYAPLAWWAVAACGTEHVIIAELSTDVLHVHSLDGQEVRFRKVGLPDGDCIWGICCSTDGTLLFATGPGPVIGRNCDDTCFITGLLAYRFVWTLRAH